MTLIAELTSKPTKILDWNLYNCDLVQLISQHTDYGHTMAKFFAAKIQIPMPNKYLRFGYKGLVFYRNNGWLMENMDKGLTVPKWVLIVWPKIPQMPKNWSAQIVCPSPKFWDFDHQKASLGVPSQCPHRRGERNNSVCFSLKSVTFHVKWIVLPCFQG